MKTLASTSSVDNKPINDKKTSNSFLTIAYRRFMGLLLVPAFLLLFTSCKNEDISVRPLANQLVGTTWVAHLGTGTNDNLEYIQVLKFTDETELYFMNYNSKGTILNAADKYTFSYTSDRIQLNNSFRHMSGYKEGNVIKLGALEYYFLDVDGSISEYLKKNGL